MPLRGLKILVIVLGVMLVAGAAVLAAAIALRLAQRTTPPTRALVAPPIFMPHGSKIETMAVGTDRIVLQVDLVDGSVQLVVIDLATGKEMEVVPLKEQP